MDKLKAMTTFVQIADAGSLSAAARQHGQSLPAVVRSLAALEAELGVRLFNRTTRRISLTDEGRQYLQSCRGVLAALHDAEAALKDEAAEPAGQLVITAPVLFGQHYVAPAVTTLLQRHPQLRCRLWLLDRVVNLLEEGMDIGVRIGPLDDSSLIARPVGQVQRMVVASPAYLRRVGIPDHPRQLQHAQCLGFLSSGPLWWRFAEAGRSFSVPVSGALEFNHIAPAIDACIAGMGFATFLSYQVADALAAGQLTPVLRAFELPPRPVNLVYPHARLLPARVRRALDWLEADLRPRLAALAPLG